MDNKAILMNQIVIMKALLRLLGDTTTIELPLFTELMEQITFTEERIKMSS